MKGTEGLQLTEEYHTKYVKALTQLWYDNKAKYVQEGKTDLNLVE